MTGTPTEAEYVYVIGHKMNFAKIGKSKDPQARLKAHQTSCPYQLWLVTQFPVDNALEVESSLHELLDDRHVRGEWFDLGPGDFDDIADMARMAASTEEFEDLEQFRDWKERTQRALF